MLPAGDAHIRAFSSDEVFSRGEEDGEELPDYGGAVGGERSEGR